MCIVAVLIFCWYKWDENTDRVHSLYKCADDKALVTLLWKGCQSWVWRWEWKSWDDCVSMEVLRESRNNNKKTINKLNFNKVQAKKVMLAWESATTLKLQLSKMTIKTDTHLSILKPTKGLFINFTYLVSFLYNRNHTSSDFTVSSLLSSSADIVAFNRSRLGNCVVKAAASGSRDVNAHAHYEMFLTCYSRTVEQSFCVVTINKLS